MAQPQKSNIKVDAAVFKKFKVICRDSGIKVGWMTQQLIITWMVVATVSMHCVSREKRSWRSGRKAC